MFFKFSHFCFQNALEQITSCSFQELSGELSCIVLYYTAVQRIACPTLICTVDGKCKTTHSKPTCQKFLPYWNHLLTVKRIKHALKHTKHAAKTECEQHTEKQYGPQRRHRQLENGFSEGNEGQTCTLKGLNKQQSCNVNKWS